MKKFIIYLCCGVFLTSPVFSQSFDLASGITENDTNEEIDVQKAEENVADDRGIFSFLNFSFIKKPAAPEIDETKTEASGKDVPVQETPLQKMTRLAESGNTSAQLSLGYMYLYGTDGVQSDYTKAFKYYEMAAAQNDKIALNNLGSLYFNGIGTKVDYLKAAQLFAQAAKQGSDDAAVNLAFIYLSGDSKNKNLDEAVKLLQQAANAGNNTAKFMLGYVYYKGFHMPQDYYKAVSLIKEAAAIKFDEAQYMLAMMYANGQGIAQNYGNSVKYLRAASSQGNVDAMMVLANILAEGTMYPRDLIQAHILYNIASVYGAKGAAEKRDTIAGALKIEELLQAQSQAEAFKAQPSELTSYIRQTFGNNIRRYIDENIKQKN